MKSPKGLNCVILHIVKNLGFQEGFLLIVIFQLNLVVCNLFFIIDFKDEFKLPYKAGIGNIENK